MARQARSSPRQLRRVTILSRQICQATHVKHETYTARVDLVAFQDRKQATLLLTSVSAFFDRNHVSFVDKSQ